MSLESILPLLQYTYQGQQWLRQQLQEIVHFRDGLTTKAHEKVILKAEETNTDGDLVEVTLNSHKFQLFAFDAGLVLNIFQRLNFKTIEPFADLKTREELEAKRVSLRKPAESGEPIDPEAFYLDKTYERCTGITRLYLDRHYSNMTKSEKGAIKELAAAGIINSGVIELLAKNAAGKTVDNAADEKTPDKGSASQATSSVKSTRD